MSIFHEILSYSMVEMKLIINNLASTMKFLFGYLWLSFVHGPKIFSMYSLNMTHFSFGSAKAVNINLLNKSSLYLISADVLLSNWSNIIFHSTSIILAQLCYIFLVNSGFYSQNFIFCFFIQTWVQNKGYLGSSCLLVKSKLPKSAFQTFHSKPARLTSLWHANNCRFHFLVKSILLIVSLYSYFLEILKMENNYDYHSDNSNIILVLF